MKFKNALWRGRKKARHDYFLPLKQSLSQDVQSCHEAASDCEPIIPFNQNAILRQDGREI
jgi:hypothetical protein